MDGYVGTPQSIDIDAGSIRPSRELIDSNDVLHDPAGLRDRYFDQGYLLLRNVLDHGSVKRAMERMAAVMARHGIVEEGSDPPRWTGKPLDGKCEESPEFKGICRELIEHPTNIAVMETVLGEPATSVPMVSYRCYPPHTPLSMVHQDGQYSPGIVGYRPVWIPLVDIDASMGGLVLAPGQHKRGTLHNLSKPPVFPISADAIPDDVWATTTFHRGDVLVIHPWTPHVGMANVSDRVRFSIDTRVQSASTPCVVLGDVLQATETGITLRTPEGKELHYAVDDKSYLRTSSNPGARLSLPDFASITPIGMRVVASVEGGRALMVRKASEV